MLRNMYNTILLVFSSKYSIQRFYKEIEQYAPNLIIFINHAKGFPLKNVVNVAKFTDSSVIKLCMPEILYADSEIIDNDRDYEDSISQLFSCESVTNMMQNEFRLYSSRSIEKIKSIIKVCSPAILEVIKFINNLLEAWNRGCKILHPDL